MEPVSERSRHEGDGAKPKEEKRSESSIGDDENRREQENIVVQEPPMTNIERSSVDAGPNASSPKKEEVDELEKTKAEMGGVMEENERLKMSLNRILNEYRTLQMQFNNIVEQETKNSSDKLNNIIEESDELVSLSLGRLPSNPIAKVSNKQTLKEEEEHEKEGLALGLDCKFETSKSGSTTEHLPATNNPSPNNSSELVPKEEAGETWPPSKTTNKAAIRSVAAEDEVISQQNPAKKARVCVRARCDTPTLNDGCQWRKYGQKISKGNPCPRAYYRCTVATSCPVRKQVQRCAQDMSILITTYEGTHNHPLPLSATAMASTTSAAASMLLSGSSTSSSHSGLTTIPSTYTTTTASAGLQYGMNFSLSDASINKSKQFYHLSHPSLSSSANSHPTITLDLTSNPPSSSSSPFARFTSDYNNPSRYPSSTTSLNFSSSESNNAVSWSNGMNGFLSYSAAPQQPYNNRNNILSTININPVRQQPMENNNIYNSYMQRNNSNIPIQSQQQSLPDSTIAAATKAITADPSFQSALAAALTSIIGTKSTTATTTQGNHHQQGSTSVGENLGQKMKWGELFSSSSALPAASTTSKVSSGCASSFLNKAPSAATTQTGSLMCLQQPLPFPGPKSASASPGDNRDTTN